MHAFVGILALVLLAFILWDAFENVILPRHVVRKFYSARTLNYWIWVVWSAVRPANHIIQTPRNCLGLFRTARLAAAPGHVGCRHDRRVRHALLGLRLCRPSLRRNSRLAHRPLHERHDYLHPGTRRRHARFCADPLHRRFRGQAPALVFWPSSSLICPRSTPRSRSEK